MPSSTRHNPEVQLVHTGPAEFTGRHMLLIMVAFFGTIILVNATLAYFAISSWTGLVVPNSYVASQTFNADTARRLEAVTRGAHAVVSMDGHYMVVRFTGKDREPLSADALAASLRHPVDAGKEMIVEFSPDGAGIYRSVTELPAGSWTGDVAGVIRGYGHWAEAVRFNVEPRG